MGLSPVASRVRKRAGGGLAWGHVAGALGVVSSSPPGPRPGTHGSRALSPLRVVVRLGALWTEPRRAGPGGPWLSLKDLLSLGQFSPPNVGTVQ